MNENVNQHEQFVARNEAPATAADDQVSVNYSDMPDEEILEHFDALYQKDEALMKILGEYPERYSVPEKQSILTAYKKGGGVKGLAEIIEDDPEAAEEEGEELDIDLENPEDVKVIHDEFRKLYDSDENFRQSFGEEAL